MAEIDPVILQLRADLAQYKSELRSTTTLVQSSLDRQSRSAQQLESQFRQSSGAIANALKGVGGALAGAFSLQQAQQLIDSYTRFQNQLKVAGLEGQALVDVQEQLFAVAQKNGVEIESVGTLYSRAAQNQRELGASSRDLIDLTSAVAASLRISGTSANEASGSLLQLSQALGSPRIQAEEFNSLLDTMQPLLREAAKRIDGTGGSLSGLTRLIKDTNGPGVSNVQLFRAITASLADLEKVAGKSGLTISSAFTKLNNELTRFVGQAAQSNGVVAALSTGIEALANNLETVADALAVIAAVMLGRFAAGMVAASASSGVLATALFAVQARAAGAATAMEALAFTSRAAGASMLAALGGPVGIAVAALALGITYLATRTDAATAAANANAEAQTRAANVTSTAADAADKLASAHGRARKEAIALARAEAENVKQKVASARASALLATVEAMRERARAQAIARQTADEEQMADMSLRGGGQVSSQAGIQQRAVNIANSRAARAEAAAQKANADWLALQAQLAGIEKKINAAETKVANVKTDSDEKAKKTKSGPTGPSPAEIQSQFASDLRRLLADQLQDELAITTDVERRREIATQLDDLEYEERLAQIENEKNYTRAQKKRLADELNKQFGKPDDPEAVRGSNRTRAQAREQEEAIRRQREAQIALERDALEAEARNATTRKERVAIEARLLELQQEEERERLEAAIAAGEIADAAKARADLERKQSADRTARGRDAEGPLGDLARDFEDVDTAIEQVAANSIRRLREDLASTITKAIGLKGALGDIVAQLIEIGIQRQLIGPLADALFGPAGGDGGGGALGGIFDSIFGRASGGYVAPGQTVRVNEHRGGVELLRMGAQGGSVIPLGQARAARPDTRPVVNQTFVLDARYGITTPELLNYVNRTAQTKAQEAGVAAYDRSLRDAPAAVSRARRFGTS